MITDSEKKDLILVHGALGSRIQFEALARLLSAEFNCHLLDFDGHGSGAHVSEISIELCSNNLIDFVHQHQLEKPLVFGYSMGGYVALYAEAKNPGLLHSIVTLGTKFDWSVEIAEHEITLLNPEKIEEKLPKFAAYLATVHAPKDWKNVMIQTHGLMRRLGRNPLLTNEHFQSINIPVTLCLGSKDNMVTQEETEKVRTQIKTVQFRLLDGIPHPIQMIDSNELSRLIIAELRS